MTSEWRMCVFIFSTSEQMYEVLDESLRRAEMNHNITYGKIIFFLMDQMVICVQNEFI